MGLKVALLGVGTMGRNHLRVLNMLKGVEISSIFDLDEPALKDLSAQYQVPYTSDAREALVNADIAIIVTPTSTHYEYFKLCAGKVANVFIEKPLAETYEQAVEIKSLAEKHNTYIQCGFIERFNPVVLELQRFLSGEEVINLDFTRTNRLSARVTDVDVILDLMIHDIDLALHLNGPVKSVVAHGSKENGLVAFCSALLRHENGSLSRLLASRMTEKKIRSIQATTSSSYIDAELVRKELVVHKQSQVIQEENKPYIISSVEQRLEVKPQEALLIELQALINAAKGNVAAGLPDVDSGVDSLRLCEKILECVENE